VAIVSGVQEALDLVARLYLNDRVCMENPGYVGAAIVFEAVGAKISAARLDDDSIELQEERLRGSRLVYVTPGHQFPMGRPECSAIRPIQKLANSWQIGFLRDIPRKEKVRIAAYLLVI
jgi:hypothetical protein